MNQVIRQGVKTKVLMLSATPVNNRFTDLTQPARARLRRRLGEPRVRSSASDKTSRRSSAAPRPRFNAWSTLPPEERTAAAILNALDFDFFELLDSVTIARSRKHIQTFYDTTDIGTFPERLKPLSFHCQLTQRKDVHRLQRHLRAASVRSRSPSTRRLSYVLPEPAVEVRGALRTPEAVHGAREPRAGRPREGHPEPDDGQPAQAAGKLGGFIPPHADKSRRQSSPNAGQDRGISEDRPRRHVRRSVARPLPMPSRTTTIDIPEPDDGTDRQQGPDQSRRHGPPVAGSTTSCTTWPSSTSCSPRCARSRRRRRQAPAPQDHDPQQAGLTRSIRATGRC